ncbi:MAG: hypothetical protein EKK46_02480 [Rhodocyclaceae bacterium]|nr:MAG: hypothetical protein EKK46_02480 [Rhodocyclaceae bacterium]
MAETLSPLNPSLEPYYDIVPTQRDVLADTWISRGGNFVIALSKVKAGAVLARNDNPDEYMVLLHDVAATIEAGKETITAAADTLTIVPPGASKVVATGAGTIVRIFSVEAKDLVAVSHNASHYAAGAPHVAPLVSWPAPPDGYRLRHYVLSEYVKPGSNMRIFRSRNLMVNVLTCWEAPRDIHKLSPHSHEDFEQGSLALAGNWVHHLRYPWTPDMSRWRDDEHAAIGSPSLTVIPPTVIHTSRNTDPNAILVDVFAPPREDFSNMSGMVRNEAEYPMPGKHNAAS